MEGLSVTIITRNEEKNLDRCLGALQGVADEIIVIDSYSTDRTVEICERYGCKVTSREFTGFGSQRQYAAGLTAHSFVLSIDADEVIDAELREALLKCKAEGFTHRIYKTKVTNYFCGTPLRHSGLEQKHSVRLFNKRYANWSLNDADDSVTFPEGLNAETLPGSVHHYRCATLDEYYKKENRIAALKSRMIAAGAADISYFTPLIKAIGSFLKSHFVQLAWLDGNSGMTIAKRRANTTYKSYMMARHLLSERKAQ